MIFYCVLTQSRLKNLKSWPVQLRELHNRRKPKEKTKCSVLPSQEYDINLCLTISHQMSYERNISKNILGLDCPWTFWSLELQWSIPEATRALNLNLKFGVTQ